VRLQIESIDIQDVRAGSTSAVKDRVLCVNFDELKELICGDSRIRSVDLDVVHPGDRVRVLNLMDVVQPRCKIGQFETDFPGFAGKLQIAGSGQTLSLRGVAVLVSNPHTKRKYSALLDMAGLGAELSKYAKMTNVHVSPHPADGIEERDFEDAVKLAGFKTAVHLARVARGQPADEVEVYDLSIPDIERGSDLPRIAYYYQVYSPQHDHLGISDPCFYGTDVRDLNPTIIHPNEVLDGGIVGHHTIRSLDTYTIQNHGVIKELYGRHGKDLLLAGVVVGAANMDPVARKRKAIMAANLIKNVLGADGVIITKIHGGMPHVDMALVGEECERLGVRTAVFTQPVISSGTLADTLLFNSKALDLIITVGSTLERVDLPLAADRFLGGTARTKVFLADPGEQHADDPVIDQEEMLIAGVHDHLGGAKIIVKEY